MVTACWVRRLFQADGNLVLHSAPRRGRACRNRVRLSNSLHALEPDSAQAGGLVSLFERWSVSEYPKGLTHQAPGRKF